MSAALSNPNWIITGTLKESVISLAQQDLRVSEIARRTGLNYQAVWHFLKRSDSFRSHSNQVLTSKVCPQCGVSFRPRRSSQVNCAARCYAESKRCFVPWNKGVKMWESKPHPRGTLGMIGLGKGRIVSAEARVNLSKSHFGKKYPNHTGEKHWNWQGGKTPKIEALRQSAEYKAWRRAVYTRDDYTCQSCGARNGNGVKVYLHADHIVPVCLDEGKIFDVNNGRTLCVPCHRATDTYGSKAHKLLRAKQ